MQLEAGFQNLRAAARFLEGEIKITPTRVDVSKIFVQPSEDDLDFTKVEEQECKSGIYVRNRSQIRQFNPGHWLHSLMRVRQRLEPAIGFLCVPSKFMNR